MNPCRCGYLGDAARECGRAPRCGEDYQNRISGPLLDRIDLDGRGAAGLRGGTRPRADRRAERRGRRARGACPGRAARAPWRGRADQQRRGRYRHTPGGGGAGARRAGDGEAAPVAARLHPHAARGPHHRRPRRGGDRSGASMSPRRWRSATGCRGAETPGQPDPWHCSPFRGMVRAAVSPLQATMVRCLCTATAV